jgi:hypothetical protein
MNADEMRGYKLALRKIQRFLLEELEVIYEIQMRAKSVEIDAVSKAKHKTIYQIAEKLIAYAECEIELSRYEDSGNQKH